MRRPIQLGLIGLALAALPLASASSQSARLAGTVTDSLRRMPLGGATVIAMPISGSRDTAFHSTRTDGQGKFVLDGLPAGAYSVSVEHPYTDSIGLSVPPREIRIAAGVTADIALALPSAVTLRRTFCGTSVTDSTLGVMIGSVRRSDRSAARGGTVVLSWNELEVDRATGAAKNRPLTVGVQTDSLGVYRACGVPVGVPVLAQAQLGAREQSGVIEERVGVTGFLVLDFVMQDSAMTVRDEAASVVGRESANVRGPGVVRGLIVDERERPVGRAQIRLFGTDRSAAANERGQFSLDGLPTGTQGFEVLALGYWPRRFRAEVSTQTPSLRIAMNRVAVVLDSVRVTAKRLHEGNRYAEFDARLRAGHGQFVTEADIERSHPFVITDMLRMMSGFATTVGRDGKVTFGVNRGVYTFLGSMAGANGGRPCPSIYVDGVPFTGDLDTFVLPQAVHGIEVYRLGEQPAKYSAFCGVILIWTK